MSRFQFRMESVLNIREKFEEKKKQEYGDAVMKLQIEKEKKQRMINEESFLSQYARSKMRGCISSIEIISCNQYMSYLKRNITNQDKVVNTAEKFTEKKRGELLEAVKQKKTLESLKEKQWMEFQQELNKEEQKRIDEIVSFKSMSRFSDGGK